MATVQSTILLLTIVVGVFCQTPTLFSGSPFSFQGTYVRNNLDYSPIGLIEGTSIKYDPFDAVFQTTEKANAGSPPFTITSYFSPYFQSMTTTCLNQNTNVYASPSGSLFTADKTNGTSCSSGSNCLQGSKIVATQTAANAIRYQFTQSCAGCPVGGFYINIPPCATCSQFSVSGGTLSCSTNPTQDTPCTALSGFAAWVTATTATVTVTGPSSVNVGIGNVGLTGSSASTCLTCQTLQFQCYIPGAGIHKVASTTGCPQFSSGDSSTQCELTDTSSDFFPILWANPSYYGSGTADSTVKLYGNGAVCTRYNKLSSVATSSSSVIFSTTYWETGSGASRKVCAFRMSNGDLYNMTSQTSLSTITHPSCSPIRCIKPLHLIFIIDYSGPMTFQQLQDIKTMLLAFPTYLSIGTQNSGVAFIVVDSVGASVVLPGWATDLPTYTPIVNSINCKPGQTGNMVCKPDSSGAAVGTTHLPAAYDLASDLFMSAPYLSYINPAIVLISAGGFTSTATSISSKLSAMMTRLSSKTRPTGTTGLAYPSTVSSSALYIGSDQTVLNTLRSIQSTHTSNVLPKLYSPPSWNSNGISAGYDPAANNVWLRSSTTNLVSGISDIVGGVCEANQQRSCVSCCGLCTCARTCAPPDECAPTGKLCTYNDLSPKNPIDKTTCCYAYQILCNNTDPCLNNACLEPGASGGSAQGGCQSVYTPPCTPNSQPNCYDAPCVTGVGCGTFVPKFNATILNSDGSVNRCFQRSCTSNKIVTNPTVTCPANTCFSSYVCNNKTGNCDATPRTVVYPIKYGTNQTCMSVTCSGSGFSFSYPTTCPNTNACTQNWCDASGTCVLLPSTSCEINTCQNATCNPSSGCTKVSCPTSVPGNQCQLAATCVPLTNAGVTITNINTPATFKPLSSCPAFVPRTCPPTGSNDPCNPSYCDPASGCRTRVLCPQFQNNNKCRLSSSCTSAFQANNSALCAYTDVACTQNPSAICVNRTCDPANGCTYPVVCPQFQNGNNRCMTRNDASCATARFPGDCTYQPTVCPNINDPCVNKTCNPATGCPTATSWICTPFFKVGSTEYKCLVRRNSSCAGPTCLYDPVNCPTTDICRPNSCSNSTGVCSETRRCNSQVNTNRTASGAICRLFNRTSCLDNTCRYYDFLDCTSTTPGVTGTCKWGSNGQPSCTYTDICPPTQPLTPTTPADKCRRYSDYVNNVCRYDDVVDCSGVTPPNCHRVSCNPVNGLCDVFTPICPNNTNTQNGGKCNYTTTCSGACSYIQKICGGLSSDKCTNNVCDPSTGNCNNVEVCPIYQNNGRCTARTGCGPCTYKINVTCVPGQCEVGTCSNSTGRCVFTDVGQSNSKCAIYNDTNKCFIRNNATCTPTGQCSYQPVVVCEAAAKPCERNVCVNGKCTIVPNTDFKCTASSPCKVATVDSAAANCCTETDKCAAFISNNKCRPQTCLSNGTCAALTPVSCPVFQSNTTKCVRAAGSQNPGCNPSTGLCTQYTLVSDSSYCPAAPDRCHSMVCNNNTGSCDAVENGVCTAACVGFSCNITYPGCRQQYCEVDPTTAKPYCVVNETYGASCLDNAPGSYCVIKQCLPNGQCLVSDQLDDSDCATRYAATTLPCYRWFADNNQPGCCVQTGTCNSLFNVSRQCDVYVCNPADNTTCIPVPSGKCDSQPFANGDLCFPLQHCDQSTGYCVYGDKNVLCQQQQQQVDACYDGYCDSTTGYCEKRNTTRCETQGPCYGVVCNVDACVTEVCEETNGTCIVNFTRYCPALDNCTAQICDPTSGCQPVPFDISLCNSSDACNPYFLNRSKEGCCDNAPLCVGSSDPICRPPYCLAGSCYFGTLSCPPYFTDENGVQNLCKVFTDCTMGCNYADVVCNSTGISCINNQCNPSTGLCEGVDACKTQNTACVSYACLTTTDPNGKCELDPENAPVVCLSNNCTEQICDPAQGCVTTKVVTRDTCNKTVCKNLVLNGNVEGCCTYIDKCIPSTPCEIATCDPDTELCTFEPKCPPTKCNVTSCSWDADGVAFCTSTPKECTAADACTVVHPCVEDSEEWRCETSPFCNASTDRCVSIICNLDDQGNPSCDPIPALNCDDSDPCTTDYCINGTCYHDGCETLTSDFCMPFLCNISVGCYQYDKYVECLDTGSLCKVGRCNNGTCESEALICDDSDLCTDDFCDELQGCAYYPHTCNSTEPCFTDDSERGRISYSPCQSLINSRMGRDADAAADANVTTYPQCDYLQCVNNTCLYVAQTCGGADDTTVIIATTLGVAAIVAIVIGAVVGAAVCGGAVYAVAAGAGADDRAVAFNNPLFAGPATEFNNPLSSG